MIYFILILTQIEAFILLYQLIALNSKANFNEAAVTYIRQQLMDIRGINGNRPFTQMLESQESTLISLKESVDNAIAKIDRMMHK